MIRSYWPERTPDTVEFGRGVLQAFTYSSRDEGREVHILRLRKAFERAGIAHALRYVLGVLTLTREAQELKGGYWFPTPVRLVPLDGSALVLAPIPTIELARHFPILRAGYARYVAAGTEISLPKQSLNDWVGLETPNTLAWTEEILTRGKVALGTTVHPEGLEFFGLQDISAASGRGTRTNWVSDSRQAILEDNRIALCRARIGKDYYRYFLGGVEKGHLTREASAPKDVVRLQYGMAARAGRPLLVEVTNEHSASIIRIHSPVPTPERRLLLALGNRVNSFRGRAYRVEVEEHSILLASVFKNLGCELKRPDAR